MSTQTQELPQTGTEKTLGTASGASLRQEPLRRRLPDERKAIVHHFSVGGHEGYLMVGLYEDGQPGEIFIRMAKEGSTIAGLMDSFGIAVSLALQFGVSLKVLCGKFSHTRFEPSGWSGNPKIGYAKSLMDYLFRLCFREHKRNYVPELVMWRRLGRGCCRHRSRSLSAT